MELNKNQADVLAALRGAEGPVAAEALVAKVGVDQSQVMGACTELAAAGLVEVAETPFDEYSLGKQGEAYVAKPLPERVIVGVLRDQGGQCALTAVPEHCDLNAGEVGQSLRFLMQKGWATKEGDQLVLSEAGKALSDEPDADEAMIAALKDGRVASGDELAADGVDVAAAVDLLGKRKGFLNIKQRTARSFSLTAAGRELAAKGVAGKQAVSQLTPQMLSDGSWREAELRPYDVTLSAKTLYPGKEHAFQRTLDKVRRVFLELGFTEVVSPWVESSFWDFDALFQPQDHPARDMQDTFYVSRPAASKLPDEELVRWVQATHEDGGDTGSTGWRYRWSRERATKPVLRTHTTAATIRALAQHAAGTSGKYFVIGPVYRRETVDYKHLPVFHQVDGIIVDPSASLASLLGTLQAFYAKMGYPKIRFRPSFFPYTEPSAEVFLWLDHRKEWVEMGGSGIFRPEVTLPLGIKDRVLAWGLGLERLAMMIHDLKSIGELYYAHMPWLREAPLCRS